MKKHNPPDKSIACNLSLILFQRILYLRFEFLISLLDLVHLLLMPLRFLLEFAVLLLLRGADVGGQFLHGPL